MLNITFMAFESLFINPIHNIYLNAGFRVEPATSPEPGRITYS